MKFVKIQELIYQTSRVLGWAKKQKVVVMNQAGKVHYLIEALDEEDFEDLVLAQHLRLDEEWKRAEREYRQGKTVDLRDIKLKLKQSRKKK